MATKAQLFKIAASLEGTVISEKDLGCAVPVKGALKGYAWAWKERVVPKEPKVPNLGVLAVRVKDNGEKLMMVEAEPEKYFTEPHYNGFPAVLVRLSKVRVAELRQLLEDAWRITRSPRKR